MGHKYASIHIKSDLDNGIINNVKDYIEKSVLETVHKQIAFLKSQNFYFGNGIPIPVNDYYVIDNGNYISIHSTDYSFESVKDNAKKIAKSIKLPVFFISNFEDDILVLGSCTATGKTDYGAIGNSLDIYGYKKIKLNTVKALLETADITDTDGTIASQIYTETEITDFELKLSSILEFDFRNSIDDIDSNHDSYTVLSDNEQLKVLKLIT